MTIRAVLMGVLLGLGIAAVTYFNDQIVRQTYLINHHLPAPVFVAGIVLLLGVNPLLRRWGRVRPMSLVEVGVVLALGLAVCGWPGTSYFRSFTQIMVLPAFEEPARPGWRGARVLAYVPGEHDRVAAGHLRDPQAIIERLTDAAGDDDATLGRLRAHLDAATLTPQTLPGQLQRAIEASGLDRREVEAALAEWMTPLRRGRGVLPAEGERDPAVIDPLISPQRTGLPSINAVPWKTWWPTIRLWGGASVLTALAVLCLMMVVHPQWSRRELLSYPTVRLVQELSQPTLLRNRLFWSGLGFVVLLHTVNGLHAWFDPLPQIARSFNFSPLSVLFPNASRASGFYDLMRPTLYPAAIGFAFLISTRVAFSVGLALPLWIAFSAVWIASGTSFVNHRNHIESHGSSLRFGAFIGVTLMVGYYGRHYYLAVARAAVGAGAAAGVPGYATWAARGLAIFAAMACAVLWRWAGIDLWLAVAVILMVLMASLVLARVNAEAGLFYVQPDWYPLMMLMMVLGMPAIGPELTIVLLIASFLLMPEPREGIAPFLINALRLTDGGDDAGPRRSAPWIAAMIVAGFVVALLATLTLQYHAGLNQHDGWASQQGRLLIDPVARTVGELVARNELTDSVAMSGLDRLLAAKPSWSMLGWCALGLTFVLGSIVAGLRLPWWPIHPVLFIVWGTNPSYYFAVSFLVAAILKWSVIRLTGERGFHVVKPLMIGLIVGDLIMIVLWATVGIAYYLATGVTPAQYFILPP
jgi:hypothetical protein